MSETPKRTLLDIFNKYNPGPEAKELLLSARDYRLRIDREQKLVPSHHFMANTWGNNGNSNKLPSCSDFRAQESSLSLFPLFPHLFAMFLWNSLTFSMIQQMLAI